METQTSIEAAARIALRCLDLTSLNDGDDEAEVARAVRARAGRASAPWPRCASGRAWRPSRAASCRRRSRVAAVANFPAGGTDIDAALREVRQIVDAGAQEVDVVLPWRALRDGDAPAADALLRAVRAACAGLRLKVILETGELQHDALIDPRRDAGAGRRCRCAEDQHRQDAARAPRRPRPKACCAPLPPTPRRANMPG